MKLTTKRNWRYFWRELFSYMIPMILIVGTIDVFYNFMQCPLHPEWSVSCNVNWILAAIYGVFLLLTIIFAIISARTLRNIKRQIEEEFFSAIDSEKNNEEILEKEDKEDKKNKKSDKKDKEIINMIEKNKHEEDDKFEQWIKSKTKKTTKRKIFKRKSKEQK